MIKFDKDVQRQIVVFGLDDNSPSSMLSSMYGGQYGATPSEWRESVLLLICAMLDAELISPHPEIDDYQGKNSKEIRDLLEQGDPENGFDADIIWDVMHFNGTEKLLELLRKLDLNEWTAINAELSLPLGKALASGGPDRCQRQPGQHRAQLALPA
ncbi:hypothetical protein F2P45_33565 [Massilia sp. CCM 8733]|uniref:Uncharacterized protein n=1 Tax=Massilia mucilaginosa TaxID=2609282 RepID=A0ABX0P4K9_9BURK|nr:hypothetical protein [Massilia mucilaginosa]NHZ93889.1 hypothetical protein [Massilia mucilaginosa]